MSVFLGQVQLESGENVITITVISDADLSGNIRGITVSSEASVITPSEQSEPVDPDPDDDLYIFTAVRNGQLQTGVSVSGGIKGAPTLSSNYLGNMACNVGASVTFTLNSTQACTAELYFSVCHRAGDFVFSDVYTLLVNGNPVVSNAAMPNNNTQWEVFEDVLLGEIELVEGTNTITISIANDRDISGNIQGISVETADSVITAVDMPDEPELPEAVRYEFKAATDGVLADNVTLGAGTGGMPAANGNYIGNISTNNGASVTFRINASKECAAKLWFSVCYRKGDFTFDEVYEITVNGKKVECNADMSYGDTQWEQFMNVDVGEVSLVDGDNVITVTVITDRDISGNIQGIALETSGAELN